MTAQKYRMMVPFVIVLMVYGCGGGGSSANISGPLLVTGTTGSAVNMNGTWKNCIYSSLDQQDELQTATFNGSQISFSNSIWTTPTNSSLNCTQSSAPDAVFTATQTAALGATAPALWTDGSSTAPPAGITNATATKATLVYHSAIITLNSTTWANNFNGFAVCSKNNWAVGAPTNVLNCTDLVPSTTFTDYWVADDKSAPVKLYTQSIGTTPYQVDSVDPYLKQ